MYQYNRQKIECRVGLASNGRAYVNAIQATHSLRMQVQYLLDIEWQRIFKVI